MENKEGHICSKCAKRNPIKETSWCEIYQTQPQKGVIKHCQSFTSVIAVDISCANCRPLGGVMFYVPLQDTTIDSDGQYWCGEYSGKCIKCGAIITVEIRQQLFEGNN